MAIAMSNRAALATSKRQCCAANSIAIALQEVLSPGFCSCSFRGLYGAIGVFRVALLTLSAYAPSERVCMISFTICGCRAGGNHELSFLVQSAAMDFVEVTQIKQQQTSVARYRRCIAVLHETITATSARRILCHESRPKQPPFVCSVQSLLYLGCELQFDKPPTTTRRAH